MARMKNYWEFPAVFFAIGIWASSAVAQTYTFTTLSYPGTYKTFPQGISGNNIVGYYFPGSIGVNGFLYNGSTWTTLVDPLGTGGKTEALGISGSNIVGQYTVGPYADPANDTTQGFLYNGSTYTTLNYPGATDTSADGICGSNIVGWYDNYNSAEQHGFLYNLSTSAYTTLDDPLAATNNGGTAPNGISGSKIVGQYTDSKNTTHGFLYNGSTWTTLDDPLAIETTVALGISGDNIVGEYFEPSDPVVNGFLYNISTQTYTTLDDPLGTEGSSAYGIDGNTIVGYYNAGGFVATLPEPSTLALLTVGAVTLIGCRWRRRTK